MPQSLYEGRFPEVSDVLHEFIFVLDLPFEMKRQCQETKTRYHCLPPIPLERLLLLLLPLLTLLEGVCVFILKDS